MKNDNRNNSHALGSVAIALALVAVLVVGCSDSVVDPDAVQVGALGKTNGTAAAAKGPVAKIRNAMSSAPASVAADATIMDWPAGPGEPLTVLREGTNGWTCFPAQPASTGNNPMCLDAQWLEFIGALGSGREPNITQMGYGYMLQENAPYSNTDPFASGPTSDNEWQETNVPHLMILVPSDEPQVLAGTSSDPNNGGPFIMWRDTPYAHIMVPMPQHKSGGRVVFK